MPDKASLLLEVAVEPQVLDGSQCATENEQLRDQMGSNDANRMMGEPDP